MNAEHSSGFLFCLPQSPPPLRHSNHPQTSAISARLGSFAVSPPRRATRSRLGSGSSSVPPRHLPMPLPFLFCLPQSPPALHHCNHPQTSATSARLGSFAVSLPARNPRRATRARLDPGSFSAPPRHFPFP